MKSKWVVIKISKDSFKDDLSITESLLLQVIEKLDKGQGCYASNAYFAEYFGLSSVTISRKIKSLHEMGYITVSYSRGSLTSVRRTLKVLKRTNYSLESQITGIINYINKMFQNQSDFVPIDKKENIQENITKKLNEFDSQQDLINFLQKYKDEFINTDGVNLWLNGKLEIPTEIPNTQTKNQTFEEQESSDNQIDTSSSSVIEDPEEAKPVMTKEERNKIFKEYGSEANNQIVEPPELSSAESFTRDAERILGMTPNEQTQLEKSDTLKEADDYFNSLTRNRTD